MPDLSLNFADLEPRQRYKLLCGLVVSRPIAPVTTLSPNGGNAYARQRDIFELKRICAERRAKSGKS